MKIFKARIISVFSMKGGVGKTTLTLNLAGLYASMKKRVLIADFDLGTGGIATCLNIDAKKDIYTMVDDINNNRYEELKEYITKYNDFIDVLACPKDPRVVTKIDSKYVDIIMARIKNQYDIILLDTTHNLNPLTLSVLDATDMNLLVLSNDPVDLKNMKSLVAIFKDSEITNYKIVLNSSKDTGKDYFTIFDMKNIIKANIDFTIDNSFYIKDIDKYVLDGKILTLDKKILSSKKKDIEKLNKMALSLLGESKEEEEDHGQEKTD